MKKIFLILFIIPFVAGSQGFELPFGVNVKNPAPLDIKFFNQAGTPYTTTAQVLSQLTPGLRHQGLAVWVGNDRYVFKNGIADSDLVLDGGGDMVLAGTQTNTGLKTFLNGTLGMRNVANTFTSQFTNTNTAARTYTLPNSNGTIALLSDFTANNGVTRVGNNFSLSGSYSTNLVFSSPNNANFNIGGVGLDDPNNITIGANNVVTIYSSGNPVNIQGNPINLNGIVNVNALSLTNQTPLRLKADGSANQYSIIPGQLSGLVGNSFNIHLPTITQPSGTQTLVLNNLSQTLTNKTMSGTDNTFSNINVSAVSGILPIGKGGTGMFTIGSPLQVLRVNAMGTGLEYASISGGISNATDADFTAITNGGYNILDGVATANRVIRIPAGENGDTLKFFNTEDTFVWSFAGETVYLADRVTVVTELLFNVPCTMERIDGLWIITN
jgi:hypothetical protein